MRPVLEFSCKFNSHKSLSGRVHRGDSGLSCKTQNHSVTMALKPDQYSLQNSNNPEVSTELMIGAKKRKAPEARSTLVSSARRIHELFTENSHGVSTELKLFDDAWIDPTNTKIVKNTTDDRGVLSALKLPAESWIDPEKRGTLININTRDRGVPTTLKLFDESWTDPKNTKTVENKHVGGVSRVLKLYDESCNDLENIGTVKVSTALTLFDETWNIDPNKSETVTDHSAINPREEDNLDPDDSEVTVTSNAVIGRTGSVRCNIDLYAERARTAIDDPWKIKKTLTESDLGNMSRLLLRTTSVRDHVLPFLDGDIIREVDNEGVHIKAWDQDSQSAHELVLKKWKTCKGYVLINKWHKDFVNRRNLKKGDVIGLYWDPIDSILHFSVLQRADDLVAQPSNH